MLAAKRISLPEPFALQFRAEFFNAFNRIQFTGPSTSLSSPSTFGKIFLNSTQHPERHPSQPSSQFSSWDPAIYSA